MVDINIVQRYVQLINVIDKTINLLRVDGLDINLPKMRCWKGSEEFSSNPGLLLFEDVFPSWPVLFSPFSVVQFLVYVFDYFIYLNTQCICVNYSQIWIIVIYFLSPMIKIEKILNTFWFLVSHFWWTLANKSFFWMYI